MSEGWVATYYLYTLDPASSCWLPRRKEKGMWKRKNCLSGTCYMPDIHDIYTFDPQCNPVRQSLFPWFLLMRYLVVERLRNFAQWLKSSGREGSWPCGWLWGWCWFLCTRVLVQVMVSQQSLVSSWPEFSFHGPAVVTTRVLSVSTTLFSWLP